MNDHLLTLKHKPYCIDMGGAQEAQSTVRPNTLNQRFDIIDLAPDNSGNIIQCKILLTNEQMNAIGAYRSAHMRGEHAVLLPREFLDQLGEITIGEHCNNPEDGEIFANFKISPAHFNKPCAQSRAGREAGITHGEVTACFLYAMLMKTVKSTKTSDISLSDIANLHLYIGCPATSAWTAKKHMNAYSKLVKTATGAGHVTIVPESRAALFTNLSTRNYKMLNAQNGILVFDFGSTTADCTYMKLGVGKLEFSWMLGASKIEHNMMCIAKKKACGDTDFYPSGASLTLVQDECRGHKEKYHSGLFPKAGKSFIFTFTSDDGEVREQTVKIDDAFMHEVVYGSTDACGNKLHEITITLENNKMISGSWAELCTQFFEHAKAQLDKKHYSVGDIVLTGGASRMPFIAALCEEVFGQKPIVEPNPEYTVSHGLAWVAIVEDRFDDCAKAAEEMVKANANHHPTALQNKLVPKIKDFLLQHIKDAADAWAAQDKDGSLSDLNTQIEDAIKNDKAAFNKLISDELDLWKNTLRKGICDAANAQAAHLLSPQAAENLLLTENVWKNMDAESFSIQNFDANSILQALNLNSILRKFAKFAVVITYAALFSIAGTDPISKAIAALIGALIGFILSFSINNDDMKANRKKSVRVKAVEQLKKHLASGKRNAELMEEINKDFEKFSLDYDSIVAQNVKNALSVLTLRRFGADPLEAAKKAPESEEHA